MANEKIDKIMPIIQQHWNNFISLVRQDLNDLYAEERSVVVEIRKLERISKILKHSEDDIEFLLLHKGSILSLDSSLVQKFSILEAFKNINNLTNAVAIRTYKEILESEKIKSLVDSINELDKKRESLQALIYATRNLIYGVEYSEELIYEICEKHKLGDAARNAIAFYPVIKTLKNERIKKTRRVQVSEETSHEQEQKKEQTELEILDINLPVVEEIPTYKDEFDKYQEQYDKIKEQMNPLLNKYYVLLNGMAPTEMQYYRIYCSLTKDELKDADLSQVDEAYDEVVARITAIKLFDAKTEIDKMIAKLTATDFSDKDDIEFLGAYVEEYELLSIKLKELDNKLARTEEEGKIQEDQKVFFLIDKTMNPIIPESIKERGFQNSLIRILKKAQAGFIQQKKGSNIMPLKINDKKFKTDCGRTVFAVRNSKIIVSYIKLNSNSGLSNDGGIMILTASLLNPNTIQEDTDRVIKDYCDQIIRQMSAIEQGDPQQLGLQSMILEEITKQGEPNMGAGEIDERKIK